MRDLRKALLGVLMLGLAGAGCGPIDLVGSGTVDVEGEQPGRPVDVVVPVSRPGRASGFEIAAAPAERPGGPPQIVYINREGANLVGGSDDASQNRSSIVGGRVAYPRFRGTDATWEQIRECVVGQFARFNVTVTDRRPAAGPYIMVMVGGNGSELGYGRGIGGVAPLDSSECSVIDRAVAFVMSDNLGINNAETICEVIAHEAGHTMSLDHEYLAADPMTYLSYNGLQTFQDVAARCGEYSPRGCVCRRPTQNSVQILTQKLGKAGGDPPPPPMGKPPEVRIESPAEGETLPAYSTIKIVATATDDEEVARVELLWKYNGATFTCPGSYCTQAGSTYTFSLYVGTGERRFQVRAIDRGGLTATTAERVINLGQRNPPEDLTIQVIEPVNGQEVKAGGTVMLKADVKSTSRIDEVSMTWSGPHGSLTSPLTHEGGDRYSLNIRISTSAPPGPRQITVFARDVAGRSATAPPVRLNLIR